MSNILAFPSHGSMGEVVEQGMSLRDYFAAKALIGLFASQAHPQAIGISASDYGATGVEAYRIADAMLKAREPV